MTEQEPKETERIGCQKCGRNLPTQTYVSENDQQAELCDECARTRQ